jgi:hypothetical protein
MRTLANLASKALRYEHTSRRTWVCLGCATAYFAVRVAIGLLKGAL